MAGNPNGRLKVAFVSDYLQATKDDKDFLAIRSGDFSTKIVQDALLFTPDFAQRESADLEGCQGVAQVECWSNDIQLVPRGYRVVETIRGDRTLD
jgi:hypothetical protein